MPLVDAPTEVILLTLVLPKVLCGRTTVVGLEMVGPIGPAKVIVLKRLTGSGTIDDEISIPSAISSWTLAQAAISIGLEK